MGRSSRFGTLATGDGPQFIKTADLDRDGHLDLVVTELPRQFQVNLFYGRGDGTFTNADHRSRGYRSRRGSAISDLNGDGRPDIAISDSGSNDVSRSSWPSGPRRYATLGQ